MGERPAKTEISQYKPSPRQLLKDLNRAAEDEL